MSHEYLVEVVSGAQSTFGNIARVPAVIETWQDPVFTEIVVQGPQGPPGAPGSSGTGYTHIQSAPSSTWTITHNMNRYPEVVLVIDSIPGERVYTDVTYPNLNTAVVTWPSSESGRAYL